jgi:hypothetical protein
MPASDTIKLKRTVNLPLRDDDTIAEEMRFLSIFYLSRPASSVIRINGESRYSISFRFPVFISTVAAISPFGARLSTRSFRVARNTTHEVEA